jgi:hypothetical protein
LHLKYELCKMGDSRPHCGLWPALNLLHLHWE